MSRTMIKTIEKPQLSIKAQTLATLVAIIGAVVLPQVFHVIGAVTGLGVVPGNTWLPMHLPIILVGLLTGPLAGTIAGVSSPLISFALTGMPTMALLPFMMIELGVYGLSAGLLRKVKAPTLGKVMITQIAGRGIRALAILASVYLFGNAEITVSILFSSIVQGLPGLVLQWVLLPLIIFWVEGLDK